MEKISRKDFRTFCKDFAYKFISTECMMEEFKNLTCGEAQEVKVHLSNSLDLDLQDWLELRGIEIE